MAASELMGRRMSELIGRRGSALTGGGVRTNGAVSELMGRWVSELRSDVRTDGVVSEHMIPLLTQSLNRLMPEND